MYCFILFASFESDRARISIARSPAFFAALIPTVATGTPGGICTIESKESSPLSDFVIIGIPITGKVEYLKYINGKYLAAFEDKASELNERSEFGINSKNGKVFFTQVAGFIARRIVYDIKLGDSVKIGERFGMIKFGSRVDVIVPAEWHEKVKKDDNVTAGETILFEITK